MTDIPLLVGVGATERADLVQSLPVNMEPTTLESGLSKGFLRSAPGVTTVTTGPGIGRGGIEWNGVHYRVMGTKLVSVGQTGIVSVLADVGGSGPVTLTYGFDRLAIRSGTNLFYWDGTALTQVTDPDLGLCLSLVWMDGYYISTDGTSIVVTDLADPTSVNPLKYGSAEQDPDQIVALFRVRNELYALGGETVQAYEDAGSQGFPFQVNTGATIPEGCVNPQSVCAFQQSFAFVGAGRNEANGVWLAQGGSAQKLSTRVIDDALAAVMDSTKIALEARVARDEQRLYLHLDTRSFCYQVQASAKAGQPVWYELRSGIGMDQPYRVRDLVYCYGQWWATDTQTNAIGVLDESVTSHFGAQTGARVDTMLIYNDANGGIVHSLELIGANGRNGTDPMVFVSFTFDGETYTMERPFRTGPKAQRENRAAVRPHKRFSRYMGIRLRSDGTGLQNWAALSAQIEPLSA